MRKFINSLRARLGWLRCRPGDICWVNQQQYHPDSICGEVAVRYGTVVKVVEITRRGFWKIEPKLPFSYTAATYGASGFITALADDILTPMRERPSDDEVHMEVAIEARQPAPAPAKPGPAVELFN